MKKKQYEKPSLEVVVLNQQPALLAGSEQVNASVGDVNWQEEDI